MPLILKTAAIFGPHILHTLLRNLHVCIKSLLVLIPVEYNRSELVVSKHVNMLILITDICKIITPVLDKIVILELVS